MWISGDGCHSFGLLTAICNSISPASLSGHGNVTQFDIAMRGLTLWPTIQMLKKAEGI
jgi:hypothetical protein